MYFLWVHLAHFDSSSKYLVMGASLLLALTSASRLGFILYRNVRPGRPWPQAKISRHGDTAHVKIWLTSPWKVQAGQYVQVWIPGISLFSTHPLVVAWWDEDSQGRAIAIHLHVRARKGFTKGLVSGPETETSLQAWIDGPYGASRKLGNYATVILLCTGVGVANQIPYIKELLQCYREGSVRTKKVVLHWELYDGDNAGWICDWMDDLLLQDTDHVRQAHLANRGSQLKVLDTPDEGVRLFAKWEEDGIARQDEAEGGDWRTQ